MFFHCRLTIVIAVGISNSLFLTGIGLAVNGWGDGALAALFFADAQGCRSVLAPIAGVRHLCLARVAAVLLVTRRLLARPRGQHVRGVGPGVASFKVLAERCKPCCRVEVYLSLKGLELPFDVREPWSDVRRDLLSKIPCTQEHSS